MKAAIDVYYEHNKWAAACVVFADWSDSEPAEIVRNYGSDARPYRPGRFYQRELPCLLSVLKRAEREFETILIDGYVHLQTGSGKGLGARLYEALAYLPAVVGVAKNPLKIADRFVPICRGRSKKPLFVSAIGWQEDQAAQCVLNMHGRYRIPEMLRLADRHGRRGGHEGIE
ncbi:MAG: endonuclease V [Desulfobacterales bacterium]|nr:endonuclease V [Desulfobacterales bacterium]